MLGVSHGVINNIVNGKHSHVSFATENHVRAAQLSTPTLGCRCLHAPIAVACITALQGKTVEVRAVRHRKPPERIADYTMAQLTMAIRNRQPYSAYTGEYLTRQEYRIGQGYREIP